MMDKNKIIAEGITFDDVLLIPARSDLVPSQADTRTRLTNNITINIPLVSAAMDTVTEASLAIALAQPHVTVVVAGFFQVFLETADGHVEQGV